MSFPTINYKYNGLEETKALSGVVDQKLAALEKFIHESADTACEVEFEKVGSQQQGRNNRVEVNLLINGGVFRAEATEESFERAIDVVRDELDRELRKAKEKYKTLGKSGGRTFKQLLQGFVSGGKK